MLLKKRLSAIVSAVDRQVGLGKEFSAMTTERLSAEEMSQVEIIKSGRQTIIEEIITRIDESEKEVFEEKHIGKYRIVTSFDIL